MKFKFVKSLDLIQPGENIVIDGFTYYVESMPRPGKSAIVSTGNYKLLLLVQTSETIEEIPNVAIA